MNITHVTFSEGYCEFLCVSFISNKVHRKLAASFGLPLQLRLRKMNIVHRVSDGMKLELVFDTLNNNGTILKLPWETFIV